MGRIKKIPLYYGHPKTPSCKEFIIILKKIMKKWNYDYIFLSCDDRGYSDAIYNAIGKEHCFRIDRPLVKYFENGKPVNYDEKYMHSEFKDYSVRQETEDYLSEIYALSYCDSLLSSYCSTGTYARLLNGGNYKNIEYINNGYWTKEDLGIKD